MARPTRENILLKPSEDKESGLSASQIILKKLLSEYTTMDLKEEALETIMSDEATASYDCLGRFQMDKRFVTRSSMHDAALQSKGSEFHKLCASIDGSDLTDEPQDSDDEFIQLNGHTSWHSTPWDSKAVPSSLSNFDDNCRMGFSSLMSKYAKGEDYAADHCFGARSGKYALIGVVNAHGLDRMSGHLALFIAQEMPRAFFRSSAMSREHDAEKGLSQAFSKLHAAASQTMDLRLTGASITAIVFDDEHVWVAHVGDCKAVLGVPDNTGAAREFHYRAVPLTEDHKLSSKKEFDRIHNAGGEVRKLMHDQICRLFVPNSNFPGLIYTRAVGARLAHTIGVIHRPTICCLKRKDIVEGSFFLLGSAGLWINMTERAAVNWVARDLTDLSAAIEDVVSESMHRWEVPNSPSKGKLPQSMPECFSSAIICFDSPTTRKKVPPPSPLHRTFVLGATPAFTPRLPWVEVKTANRTLELRRMLANASPRLADVKSITM